MIKADKIHKQRVIDILSVCFDTNKTVNWIVKQDSRRKERIRHLIDYSFESCVQTGQVYVTEDVKGVIICSLSDDKLPILEEAFLSVKFVLKVTGMEGLGRAIRREDYIKRFHPQDQEFLYIWFIGVEKSEQRKGIGSAMLQEIIHKSNDEQLPIYTETSEEAHLKFYKKHGFELYHVPGDDVFGYKLYFLRRLLSSI